MTKKTVVRLVPVILVLLVTYGYYKIGLKMGSGKSETMIHDVAILDEKAFLFEMIPHHMEAVEVTNGLLNTVTDPELKSFMEKIIEVQSKEIADMKIWYKNWYGTAYEINPAYKPMMGDLSKFSGRDREKIYIEAMVFHHKGAVEMAKSILKLELRPETKKLAENIIASQEAEIALLESWLASKYVDVKAIDPVQHRMTTH